MVQETDTGLFLSNRLTGFCLLGPILSDCAVVLLSERPLSCAGVIQCIGVRETPFESDSPFPNAESVAELSGVDPLAGCIEQNAWRRSQSRGNISHSSGASLFLTNVTIPLAGGANPATFPTIFALAATFIVVGGILMFIVPDQEKKMVKQPKEPQEEAEA